ncbi:DNA binding [Striga asiatica]|uniref:DNA binding n=1 Tax=Striga asiatica TaxID=4170 RepID=A0A5A7QA50_STRAF|nr:DNA binding [Striga asiatica]
MLESPSTSVQSGSTSSTTMSYESSATDTDGYSRSISDSTAFSLSEKDSLNRGSKSSCWAQPRAETPKFLNNPVLFDRIKLGNREIDFVVKESYAQRSCNNAMYHKNYDRLYTKNES